VHGNVDSKPVEASSAATDIKICDFPDPTAWGSYVAKRLQKIFCDLYPDEEWNVSVKDVVKVKSYAPHVDHLVADIFCSPT